MAARSRVHNVGVLMVFDAIQNVWTTFMHFVDQTWVDARFAQNHRCTVSRIQLVTQFH
ncbi:Uncharacterised protein [Vibrio cholerae]|nr:Uncharacterised protein [Vibrio cholerae]CSC38429.1 Uncharacterised protein [Vibrio cholerae]